MDEFRNNIPATVTAAVFESECNGVLTTHE